MKNIKLRLKASKRREWCDECYNFVDSDLFIVISESGGEGRFFSLCRVHAGRLAERIFRALRSFNLPQRNTVTARSRPVFDDSASGQGV